MWDECRGELHTNYVHIPLRKGCNRGLFLKRLEHFVVFTNATKEVTQILVLDAHNNQDVGCSDVRQRTRYPHDHPATPLHPQNAAVRPSILQILEEQL